MSKPKNFTTLYIVIRECTTTKDGFPVATCRTLIRSEELVGKYTQQMTDYGITKYKFYAVPCVYYDE